MELLQNSRNPEYPSGYLLSRLRGRRVFLIMDWKELISSIDYFERLSPARHGDILADKSSEGIWRHLMGEFRWVYLQMNGELRNIFWPFFLYSELKTIFFCLRYKTAGESRKIEQILALSLLSKKAASILRSSKDVSSTIKDMEALFVPLSKGFGGIKEVFVRDGLKGVERKIANNYLENIIRTGLHPVLKAFFSRVIDSRNIIALYKNIRWDIKNNPFLINGGTINETAMVQALEKKDISAVSSAVRKLTGKTAAEIDNLTIENHLYRGISGFLLRESRKDPTGVGLILDYLWRCSMEARGLDILFHGRDVEKGVISRELLQ